MIRTAKACVLAETPYSFRTRFENEKGTNPEELIAATNAGCFTMALALAYRARVLRTELATEAAVAPEPGGRDLRIIRSALSLRAKVPNLDEAAFNATITLDAKLIKEPETLTPEEK